MNLTSNSNQQLWSELLCCIKCKEVFTQEKLPVNLVCGHLMCKICTEIDGVLCPLNKSDIKSKADLQYVNGPILSFILGKEKNDISSLEGSLKSFRVEEQQKNLENIETIFYGLANNYLCKINSDKGATISSLKISRTIQRKLLSILCANILSAEGKGQLINNICSMVERIVSELILHIQSNANLSSSLWTAVRMRGCQFLGPAMQEDVLKIIHYVMCRGEKLERKYLVMYIVDQLVQDYSHISKTCVGHVVQLLYRASCFNVIKREGQSSQMQLKDEFRRYEQLRAEHDAQIVQIAMETGLRISAEQWSSLLYGDMRHRQYMQTICARLNDNSLKKAIEELEKIMNAQSKDRNLHGISNISEHLKAMIDFKIESLTAKELDLTKMETILECANSILKYYSKYIQNRNIERQQHRQQMVALGDRTNLNMAHCQFLGGGGPFEMPQSLQQFGRPLRRNPNRMFNNGNGMEGSFSRPIPPLLPPSQQSHSQQPLSLGTPNYMMDPQQQQGIPLIGSSPSPPNFIMPPLPPSLPTALQMSIGTPPPSNTFITTTGMPLPPQLCMTPPPNIPTMDRRDSGCGYSQPDSFETVTTLMTVLPLSPMAQRQIPMPNLSTSPPPMFTNGPSIILLGGNGTTPTECTQCTTMTNGTTTFITPTHQPQNGNNPPAALFSTTPPTTYQINAGGLISNPTYPVPVQQPPQSLVLYGSTPPAGPPFTFGSPPLLFPQWVTPMESAATLNSNLQSLFCPPHFYGETVTAESSETGRNGFKQHQQHRQSPLTIGHGHHDDDKCHVSFIVATSVLSEDKLSGNNSVGASSWTLELPAGNVSIPLSPLKYAVAHVSSSEKSSTTATNICAALTMNAASVSSLIEVVDASSLMVPPSSSMHHHEMTVPSNHLSISS